jgi:hypothetical protein
MAEIIQRFFAPAFPGSPPQLASRDRPCRFRSTAKSGRHQIGIGGRHPSGIGGRHQIGIIGRHAPVYTFLTVWLTTVIEKLQTLNNLKLYKSRQDTHSDGGQVELRIIGGMAIWNKDF